MFEKGIDKQTFVRYNECEQMFKEVLTMKRRYKIKNKYRFITFVTLMVIAISMVIGAAFPVSAAQDQEYNYKEVKVQSGDTLWKIARTYGDPSRDVREIVYEICDINSVEAGSIYPGQTLKVPY